MAGKSKRKSTNFRQILKAVALICVIVAVGLFLRAYFLDHQPGGTPFSTPNNQLGQNSPTALDSVSTELTNPNANVWGNDITDPFTLPATDGAWIELSTSQNLYVGTLSDRAFASSFTLPLNAAVLHLYADGSLLYFTASTNTSDAEMVGVKGTTVSTLLRLEPGWEFNSVYFEPTQKQFYIDIYDHSGHSKIQVIRQNADTQDIADTSYYIQPAILGVDAATNHLVFQSTGNNSTSCVTLDLIAKTTQNKDCAGVQINADNEVVTVNSPSIPPVADFKGSILLTTTVDGNQQFIKVGDPGDVFSLPAMNNGNVAVLYSKIAGSDAGVQTIPTSIQIYALAGHQLNREIKLLPAGITELILDHKLKVYAVADDAQGESHLWSEPKDNETAWQEIKLDICSQGCKYTEL